MKLCAVALLVLLDGLPQDGSDIVIVSGLPRTGAAVERIQPIVNGIRMALDELPGGKVGAWRIVYRDLDYGSATGQRNRVEQLADEVVADPDVMAYIGTFNSGAAARTIPLLNEHGLLMISPAATSPGLTKPGKGRADEPGKYRKSGRINFVRIVMADDVEAEVGADWAKEMGHASVFVVHDGRAYGKGMAESFRAHAAKIGLRVAGFEQQDNLRLEDVHAAKPDLVYFGGVAPAARELVPALPKLKFMLPDGCFDPALVESVGAALDDRCHITTALVPPGERKGKGREFADAYEKKWGHPPSPYAAYGYEAMKVALEAIRRAGRKDRNAIREACLAIRDFDGALGRWSFDANGDTTDRTAGGYVVRDGEFRFVKALGGGP